LEKAAASQFQSRNPTEYRYAGDHGSDCGEHRQRESECIPECSWRYSELFIIPNVRLLPSKKNLYTLTLNAIKNIFIDGWANGEKLHF